MSPPIKRGSGSVCTHGHANTYGLVEHLSSLDRARAASSEVRGVRVDQFTPSTRTAITLLPNSIERALWQNSKRILRCNQNSRETVLLTGNQLDVSVAQREQLLGDRRLIGLSDLGLLQE